MSVSPLTPEQRKIVEEDNLKPFGSNLLLKKLFLSIDKVLIKRGGVYNGRALGQIIDFTIDDPQNLREFVEKLTITEPKEVLYCMCLGDYALEIYYREKLRATLGLHNGTSIRYDGWKGDAELSHSNDLLKWLSAKGYHKPLIEFQAFQ
jgi:hypothetical protein